MSIDRRDRAVPMGRWQVERERARLDEPAPPFKDGTVGSIADVIPGIMKKLGLSRQGWTDQLAAEWPAMAGAAAARHSRPGRMENQRLIVFVDSSVWLNEMSRYGRRQLLDRLQQRFGREAIQALSYQLDPDGGSPGTV